MTYLENWEAPAGLPLPNSYLAEALQGAAERARNSRADSTRRAYSSDWADFEAACEHLGVEPKPSPQLVAIYVDQLARRGAKVSTIRRRLAAINARLRSEGAEPLSLRDEPLASVWRGVQRDVGAPPRTARAMELAELRSVVQACGDDLAGLRDRALLLLGFAGAFRRSELTGLHWAAATGGGGDGHVQPAAEGLRIVLRRSKTNQTGDLEEVAICRGAYAATCPVRALEEWEAAVVAKTGRPATGTIFRGVDRHGRLSEGGLSGSAVAEIVRRAVAREARRQGATEPELQARLQRLSGHSLRSGLVTTAFAAGLSAEDVMRQTRHRNLQTLVRYRRHATAFVANVSGRIGL
jgi:integrase